MTYAPYLVYTPDKDFVLEKDDVSGGGGSGGGVFTIEVDGRTDNFNKTYKEIKDAYDSGKICILELVGDRDGVPYTSCVTIIGFVETTENETSIYGVGFINSVNGDYVMAFTDSENGYPNIVSG